MNPLAIVTKHAHSLVQNIQVGLIDKDCNERLNTLISESEEHLASITQRLESTLSEFRDRPTTNHLRLINALYKEICTETRKFFSLYPKSAYSESTTPPNNANKFENRLNKLESLVVAEANSIAVAYKQIERRASNFRIQNPTQTYFSKNTTETEEKSLLIIDLKKLRSILKYHQDLPKSASIGSNASALSSIETESDNPVVIMIDDITEFAFKQRVAATIINEYNKLTHRNIEQINQEHLKWFSKSIETSHDTINQINNTSKNIFSTFKGYNHFSNSDNFQILDNEIRITNNLINQIELESYVLNSLSDALEDFEPALLSKLNTPNELKQSQEKVKSIIETIQAEYIKITDNLQGKLSTETSKNIGSLIAKTNKVIDQLF